ncbi:alpha/beta hydrolase [Oxalobacteraceae bacterium OM1]|nr:alpha/beta hydrolase [Oxalobacteraceae bacterium OM1]
MPTIDVNGIRLCYDVQGDPRGEPILLIAGLGLQLISWPETFCRTLVEHGFRVIRFDNRDSGLSSKMSHLGRPNLGMAFFRSMFHFPLHAGYALDDMAADAVGLLDVLGVERAHVVGASMGGMIAQLIAGKYPERTLTLTSVMSTSSRVGLPGPTLAASSALFASPRNPRDFDSVVDHFVHLFRVIGSPKYPTPAAELRRRVMESVRRNATVNGTARQLMAIAASGDRVMLLRTIKAPTLVIHGTADPLVPVAGGRDVAYLVPGAELREIEGMGHDIPPGLEVMLAELIAAHCKGVTMTEARQA